MTAHSNFVKFTKSNVMHKQEGVIEDCEPGQTQFSVSEDEGG